MANKKNPYKDVLGLTGYVMGSFPETMMDIEDAIGFGKIYEGDMKGRGKKSTKNIDEDYSGRKKKDKKVPIIKPDPNQKIYVGGKKRSTKTERESKLLNKKDGGYMKKDMMGGGYMKKNMAGGGLLKTVDVENNPGLAKLPTPVRNKMGFAKDGGKVYNKKHGGKAITSKMSGDDLVKSCYDKSA